MRELILKMSISIDGFVAAPDGELRWVFDTDHEARSWTVETVWNASLHIMGSRTFQDMAAYWPTSTEVFAPPMNQSPKAVFSRQGLAALKAANTTAALRCSRQCGDRPVRAITAGRRELGGGLCGGWRSCRRSREAQGPGRQADHRAWRGELRPQSHRGGPRRSVRPAGPPDRAWKGFADFLRRRHAETPQADELENLSGWRGSADLSAVVSGSCSCSGIDCPPAVQTMIFWRCIRRASCVTRREASAGDRVVEDDIHRLRGIAQQLARFFIPILG